MVIVVVVINTGDNDERYSGAPDRQWTMSGLGVKTELIGDLITQLFHSSTSYNVTFIPLASISNTELLLTTSGWVN